MPSGNGSPPSLEEVQDHLERRLREDAQAQAVAASSDGSYSPYAGEWDFDLRVGADDCPDVRPAPGAQLDARLLCVQVPKSRNLREARAWKRVQINSFDDLNRYRGSLMSRSRRLREAWGAFADPFAFGSGLGDSSASGGPLGQFVPLLPGPVTRQLYWVDYFGMSAKAFEAYNHDPVSWRCVHMKQEFALGKGLQSRVTYSRGSKAGQAHEKGQAIWDEFWKRNKMSERCDTAARDLSWGGEQFFRYFPAARRRLTVRSLDPASIYDIITDQEDIESVFGYHQQFQTPYQLWAPPGNPPLPAPSPPEGPTMSGATTRYIIRQIPAPEVDHYKINASAFERRGRSDLFPALGWIKRLRDYLTSHVVRADLLSRICWDLMVDGNLSAVQQVRGALFPNGQAPLPGTVFGHNSKSTLTALIPQGGTSGSRWDPTLDALVTMVANSIGLPKDWLGFGLGTTRASALVATEPAARSLEDLQGKMEGLLHDSFDRVMRQAGVTDAELETTFPSIATEDRSAKLQDLSFMEANGWISKRTAASIAAKEVGITTYDFDEEQGSIADEFPPEDLDKAGRPKQGDGVMRRPMIVASNRQAAKLDPTRSIEGQEDEPPGLLVPLSSDGSAPPGLGTPDGAAAAPRAAPGGQPAAPNPTRSGFPGNENPLSGQGAKALKAKVARESGVELFTAEEVLGLLRETGGRRRRPDDPAFEAAAAEYRRGAAENLAELAKAASGTGTPPGVRRG